jgi:hypothetical protein
MSFDESSRTTTEIVSQVSNDQEKPSFNSPTVLNEMLQNKELLTCYKCKQTFSIEDNTGEHSLNSSNNILLGIILNQRTPSSICLKCLSIRMMEVITEQFTKNSKDYEGLFFSYEHKFKV